MRKGCKNDAPDALSHIQSLTNAVSDIFNQPDMSIAEIRTLSNDGLENTRLDDLRKAAEQDEYQLLKKFIFEGFPPHHSQLPDLIKQYWNTREHLTLNNLIINGCRLLIPAKMRQQVLTHLHESHQGAVRTQQRARLSIYWPGINNDIDNTILACQKCQDRLPSNAKEPIVQKPRPSRPFQEIAGDLCHHAGLNYLITVDCYTDWPDISPLGNDTTSPQLPYTWIFLCSKIFANFANDVHIAKIFYANILTWPTRHDRQPE